MQFGWRTFLFVVLLLAMLVLSYPLLFKPLNDERDRVVKETADKQQTLNDLTAKMSNAKNMAAEIESLQKAITFLESKLPAATEMDNVLRQVWQAANNNKLVVKSVRNDKTIEGTDYNEQPIHMVIEGPFRPGFVKFLSEVEQLPRLTKINQMKIQAGAQNPGAVSVELTLTIYYEPSQKVAVAP
jgi:Tfp pilus assembly protein PilO